MPAIARTVGAPLTSVYQVLTRGPAKRRVPASPPRRRPVSMIGGRTARYVRTLARLGYDGDRIATLLVIDRHAVSDFLLRLEPVRKAELARPRERSEQERLRANQAAAAARVERRRILTPPAGWSNGDRLTTGEARDWTNFMTALHEARASGADILGLASRVWFAPPRSRPQAPPVKPAIWTGPENPYVGNPKLTPEMIAEIHALRLQGWSTGKLAKRYAVTRATICYALSRRTFRDLVLPSPPPFVADPLARPDPAPRERAPEEQTQPGRAPEAGRDESPHVITSPIGWSHSAHCATGEGNEWAAFLATTAEARTRGADPLLIIPASSLPEPATWRDGSSKAPR